MVAHRSKKPSLSPAQEFQVITIPCIGTPTCAQLHSISKSLCYRLGLSNTKWLSIYDLIPTNKRNWTFYIWNFKVSLLSSMMKAIRRIFSWKLFFLRKKKKNQHLGTATDAVAVTPLCRWGRSISQSNHSLGQQEYSLDHPRHPLAPGHPFPGTEIHLPPRCFQLQETKDFTFSLILGNKSHNSMATPNTTL